MRLLKYLLSTLSAASMMLAIQLTMRAPTAEEIALLGPEPARMELAQTRLARMIVAVDEEAGSRALASLTGADPEIVRRNLRLTAGLDRIPAAPRQPGHAPPGWVEDTAPSRVRDMPDGGARFVRVD